MVKFIAEGGVTNFVKMLSESLGIQKYQIEVLSVYDQDSNLIINYEIEPLSGHFVSSLEDHQIYSYQQDSIKVGAPIIEFFSAISHDNTGTDGTDV